MSRKDIYKDGKKFSKDYQPAPERKRVPKWKTRIKKALEENFDEIMDGLIKEAQKNPRAFEVLMDRAYGKVKDQIEANINETIDIKVERDYDID